MKKQLSCWSFGIALALGGAAFGTIINVPGDQLTIQGGIDFAVDGDTVAVAAGVFSGPGNRDIDFKGKHIRVAGVSATTTIIDCGGSSTESHGGLVFQGLEDSTSVLADLTIQHAWRSLPGDSGAIDIRGSASPTVVRCAIVNNASHGIVVAHYAGPDLLDLTVSHNAGWGMWMPGYPAYSHGVRVERCSIDHNAWGGLQLTMAAADRPNRIRFNTIVENELWGLYLEGEPPLKSAAAIDTNTYIEQNIIAFNHGYGIFRGCCWFPGLHFYRNDVYGNTTAGWNWLGNLPDSVCMLSADPQFCRQQGGDNPYTVGELSLCLSINNACGVHIGAYDQGCANCCVGYRGNVDCDGSIDISDLTRLIDFAYISFQPLCCFDAANLDGAGQVDISDLTFLIDYLYISFTPPPSCP